MRTLTITRGRVVDYHCGESDDLLNPGPDGLLSAFVSFVNPDGSVNVSVHAADGNVFARAGVPFFGIDQTLPESGRYCLWPEAIVRMEKSAERFENDLLKRGTTLEAAARGDFTGATIEKVAADQLPAAGGPPKDIQGPTANDAPTKREPTIADQAESGNGDAGAAFRAPPLEESPAAETAAAE